MKANGKWKKNVPAFRRLLVRITNTQEKVENKLA